jgi:hypothetical protein
MSSTLSPRAARLSTFHDSTRPMIILRWLLAPFVIAHIVLATISGYRAIVQIYRVEILTNNTPLRAGSNIHFTIATSGRASADAVLELIQPPRTETLTVLFVRGHRNGVYNPFTIHASKTLTLTAEQLTHFQPGPATLRLTGNGRSQWLRIPPPVITERRVAIAARP